MSKHVIISNVHIFDGISLHAEQQTVALENGVITSIEPASDATANAETGDIINGMGQTLMPGLIDCHVHLPAFPKDHQGNVGRLQSLARAGVTTALDMGWMTPAEVTELRESAQQPLTDIRFVGLFATASGSRHSSFHVPRSTGFLVDSEADAVRFVKDRIEEGVDYVKIVADVPGPTQAVINKLVLEARKADKLTIAHAARLAAYNMAREGGVDILTHAPLDTAVSEADAIKIKTEGLVVVPTLIMDQTLASGNAIPGLSYAAAKESVSRMHRAGVTILTGTDANGSRVAPVQHGPAMWKECELLVDAGLSTQEVLQAATSLAAGHFRLHDRGVVRVGKRADLILVQGNPLDDIQALKALRAVWIIGEAVNLA
ncbi:amidohydrolase [Viridothelium virens]|uniref:Amidohydrolase n=1 Tax=Viridothelium virens TaxID=1048519 RepID=A0A6A6H9M7_VIRVR|nr:amidohydrolase [Viridothelium virens]